MATVTQVVKITRSPGNNYIKASDFNRRQLKITEELNPINKENIHPTIVGLAVDYLTRFQLEGDIRKAFSISIRGAEACSLMKQSNTPKKTAEKLLGKIEGLDMVSVSNACKLVTFDVWYRNPFGALEGTKDYKKTNPNKETTDNIKVMVDRSIRFFEEYGPVTKFGFDFKPNGYSERVTKGDGDYLTKDTLWDFKVSKNHPDCKNALQILMYWVMGQHSGQDCFKDISKIGIFNPRLNIVYTYKISQIFPEIIEDVEELVIRY